MRTLSFIVKGQTINKDPACNFNNIVAGSSNYYIAEFKMNSDWDRLTSVAVFESAEKMAYMPIKKGQCIIPDAVLNESEYYVSLIGVRGKTKISTNKTKVVQIENRG